MSPHQRELILAASAVKSRWIWSARAAAAGPAMVVLRHRFGARPRIPAHRPVPALTQLHDLGLELRRERAARPGPLPPHALHGRTSFRGRTPDDGCPSKRARPRPPSMRIAAPATLLGGGPLARATQITRLGPNTGSQGQRASSRPLGGSACVIHSLCRPVGGGQPPRERAIPRANADRSQATASYVRRLSSLVKCPLSDTEPRPATPGR